MCLPAQGSSSRVMTIDGILVVFELMRPVPDPAVRSRLVSQPTSSLLPTAITESELHARLAAMHSDGYVGKRSARMERMLGTDSSNRVLRSDSGAACVFGGATSVSLNDRRGSLAHRVYPCLRSSSDCVAGVASPLMPGITRSRERTAAPRGPAQGSREGRCRRNAAGRPSGW